MIHYNFDIVPDRRCTESVKWQAYDPDVLPMWVADMDFPSPEPVIRALRERIDHRIFGYPVSMPALKETIAARMDTLYGWKVNPNEVVLVPGVVTGFEMALHMVYGPGSAALIQTPVYPPIYTGHVETGLVCQEAPLVLQADGSYTVDFDAFEAAITGETRVFLLCNPHNPVGRVYTRQELTCMAEICLRKDILICSDEIHSDIVFSGHPHTPIAALSPDVGSRTITLLAASKTYNIAGLQCAAAIIQDEELRKRYLSANKGLVHGVNLLGQVASLAAYREGQEWLDQLLPYLKANRDYLYETIHRDFPGVEMAMPEGTYLAWLDFRHSGINGSPSEFFLQHARVALNEGAAFGENGQGFARLNFGCPRPMLVEAIERMKRAYENR